jgi:pyruvate-formate lyase-activating enzyme
VSSATELHRAEEVAGRSGFLPDRIVHLHPTRLCNLACLHCYSTSDPGQRDALGPESITAALGVLRAEGYAVVSLSGGEPLVYKPLRAVVDGAHELGFRVTMISNGLLANERALPLLSSLDGIAISFDGLAATHDAMRGRAGAFDRASAALELLAANDLPVGAAISVTREALGELPDLADHVVACGARSIQVRPVARAGRARTLDETAFHAAADLARLYLVVLALREELPDEVRINCDLAPAEGLWRQREAYVGLLGDCSALAYEDRPLADLVNPLVLTETGALKPIAYDFHEQFDVGSVAGLSPESLRRYKRERLPAFQTLVGGALAGLRAHNELVDWFDHCTRVSEIDRSRPQRSRGEE